MPVSAKLLETLNDEMQNIPVAAERWPELAIELNQLRSAADKALGVHDFDRDPADFRFIRDMALTGRPK